MSSDATWGRKEVEVNANANTAEGGIGGAEKGGGDIIGALVVVTPTLNKAATMVDKEATTGLAEVAGALTSTAI